MRHVVTTRLTLCAAAVLAASGCNAPGADTQATAESRADPVEKTASAGTAAPRASDQAAVAWTPVRLAGLECGDNCYILYQTDESPEELDRALCRAAMCRAWEDAGAMPENLSGARAEIQLGTAEQVDGSGTVMDGDFTTVTAMRLIQP